MARRIVAQKGCLIEHCPRRHKSRGYCDAHYFQWRTKGDPLALSRSENFPFKSIDAEGFIPYFWRACGVMANPDKCWVWQRGCSKAGYGQLKIGGARYLAHRLAWQLANGREPRKGMEILHSCDKPPCCNPNHLREGTHADNMGEALERGRLEVGSARYNTHLTEDDVKEIRQRLANGAVGQRIAEQYQLSPAAVSSIKHRTRWKHVES